MRYRYILDDRHRPVAVSDVMERSGWLAGHGHDYALAFTVMV
jgi:hypothetical protein